MNNINSVNMSITAQVTAPPSQTNSKDQIVQKLVKNNNSTFSEQKQAPITSSQKKKNFPKAANVSSYLRHSNSNYSNNLTIALTKSNSVAAPLQKYSKEKNEAIAIVKKNGLELEHLSDQWKDDLDVVLVAVKQNFTAEEFASERLQNHPEIMAMTFSDFFG
jgi:hypothetical protein